MKKQTELTRRGFVALACMAPFAGVMKAVAELPMPCYHPSYIPLAPGEYRVFCVSADIEGPVARFRFLSEDLKTVLSEKILIRKGGWVLEQIGPDED